MTILAGIFHSEADLDRALNTLYSHDIPSKKVTLLHRKDETDKESPTPIVGLGSAPGSGTQAGMFPGAMWPAGVLEELNVPSEPLSYYHRAVREGAKIVLVHAEEDQVEMIDTAFKEANASRIDHLDN
jgi:hypothetical protein